MKDSLRSEIEEILDDAFQRGAHFCGDDDGECSHNDYGNQATQSILEAVKKRIPEKRGGLMEIPPTWMDTPEDLADRNKHRAECRGWNDCRAEITKSMGE